MLRVHSGKAAQQLLLGQGVCWDTRPMPTVGHGEAFSLDPPVSAASSDNLNKDLLPTPQPSVKYCVGERAATQRPRPDQGVKRYESDG